MSTYQIELSDPDHAVSFLSDFLSGVMEENGIPPEVENAMQLAAEEAVVNIYKHGYKGTPGRVEVQCFIQENLITLSIQDEAPFFDPLSLPSPDVQADLDERRIGGLGVYLIRSLMDDVVYRKTLRGNCLVMKKSFSF